MVRLKKTIRAALSLAFAAFAFAACEDDGKSTGVYFNTEDSVDASNSKENVSSSQDVAADSGSNDSESSKPSESSLSASAVLPGTWQLVASDGSSWFVHFASDGTWKITDDAAGTIRRVYGSYTTTGETFSGNMKNPGVGEGTISGKLLSGTSLDFDFCEHWHSPYKHVAYTGRKQ